MPLNDHTGTYTVTARVLHWFTAIIVIAIIPAGIVMDRLGDGPVADFLYDLHRSLGALLLVLAIVRLGWRFRHPAPPLPFDIPAVQQLAAHASHWLLYILLIAQPLIGWIATSAYRAPFTVFWVLPMPPIWPENRAFSDMLFEVHKYIGWTLGVLVCIHIAAALFHHFVRRDRVLMRMVVGS
jgi:cytochrome b561